MHYNWDTKLYSVYVLITVRKPIGQRFQQRDVFIYDSVLEFPTEISWYMTFQLLSDSLLVIKTKRQQ